MWTRLNVHEPETHIAASLADKYNVPKERILADIGMLKKRLEELGMTADVIRSHIHSPDLSSSAVHSSFPWYGKGEDSNQMKPRLSTVLVAILVREVGDLR
jgi:hypothetical protein